MPWALGLAIWLLATQSAGALGADNRSFAPDSTSSLVEVALKDHVVVDKARIRLSDVAIIVGADAELKDRFESLLIGRSPLPGYSMQVTRHEVASVLEAIFPGIYSRISWSGPAFTRVQAGGIRYRPEIYTAEAENLLRKWLGARFKEYQVHPVGDNKDFVLSVGNVEARPSLKPNSSLNRRMCVWVELWVDGEFQRAVPVWFAVSAPGRVLALRRDVPTGHRLSAEDVEFGERDLATLHGRPIESVQELSGMRSSRALNAGEALVDGSLEPMPPVVKGEQVSVHATSGPVHLVVPAIAEADGYPNQRIRVKKIESGESYSVRVIGKGEATTDDGTHDGHQPSASAGPDGKN